MNLDESSKTDQARPKALILSLIGSIIFPEASFLFFFIGLGPGLGQAQGAGPVVCLILFFACLAMSAISVVTLVVSGCFSLLRRRKYKA